ncbi:MAG TPA: hypothetical protein VFE62_01440 [Gemmataceae bacterium]|nr:hypothetical protein [Gemmataceae bacterium]
MTQQVAAFDMQEFNRLIREEINDFRNRNVLKAEIAALEEELEAKKEKLQNLMPVRWGDSKAGAYANAYISAKWQEDSKNSDTASS